MCRWWIAHVLWMFCMWRSLVPPPSLLPSLSLSPSRVFPFRFFLVCSLDASLSLRLTSTLSYIYTHTHISIHTGTRPPLSLLTHAGSAVAVRLWQFLRCSFSFGGGCRQRSKSASFAWSLSPLLLSLSPVAFFCVRVCVYYQRLFTAGCVLVWYLCCRRGVQGGVGGNMSLVCIEREGVFVGCRVFVCVRWRCDVFAPLAAAAHKHTHTQTPPPPPPHACTPTHSCALQAKTKEEAKCTSAHA